MRQYSTEEFKANYLYNDIVRYRFRVFTRKKKKSINIGIILLSRKNVQVHMIEY